MRSIYLPTSYTVSDYLVQNGKKYDSSTVVVGYHHRLQRSDVTRNKRDPVTGWRKPSEYTLTEAEVRPFMGALVETRTYNDPAKQAEYGYTRFRSGRIPELTPSEPTFPQFPINLRNACEVKALSKIQDAKINVGLTLAEINKTISMIANRAAMIAKSYNALRSGNFKKAYQAIGFKPGKPGKSASEMTLEVQYGWRPLMADVMGAYDLLRSGFRKHGVLIKGKARVSQEYDTPWEVYALSSAGNYSGRRQDTVTNECQVILWYEVVNPHLLMASSVGLTNPFTIAWELVPFSFIVDWFIPVGQVLSGLTVEHGLAFKGGTITTRQKVVRHSKLDVIADKPLGGFDPGHLLTQGNGVGVGRIFTFTRSVYGSSPLPRFYYKNPISAEHALNALALFGALRR